MWLLFRHAVRKSKRCIYIVMSETPRKKFSGQGRPAKQPLCNDFRRVWSVNVRTYYRQFNQNRFSMENLFEEPKRAGMEKCRLVDLLWNLSDKHRSAQQKMKLNFPPAISFMYILDRQWMINPISVSSSIWSSTILFSRATTEMHVFGLVASFTTQHNWKNQAFSKTSRQNCNNVTTGDKSFQCVTLLFHKAQIFISQSTDFTVS